MIKVHIDDVGESSWNPAERVVRLSNSLQTTELAINYYVLGPGDQFGFDFHRHNDQEEVFFIQSGTVTFETETDEIEVSAGEMVRFAPNEFQLGVNRGEEHAEALALGAPRDSSGIEYLRECPSCEDRTVQTLQPFEEVGEFVVLCNVCETDTVEHLRE